MVLAALSTAGCLAASLTSTHQKPVEHFPKVMIFKIIPRYYLLEGKIVPIWESLVWRATILIEKSNPTSGGNP